MGEVGKIALLVDDLTYATCKPALDSVYEKPLEGMAAIEPYLKTIRCTEDGFTKYFKHNYNLCVVYNNQKKEKFRAVLGDDLIELIEKKLDNDESVFVVKDVFSTPQEICFILGNDPQDVKSRVYQNADKLLELALRTEKRTTRNVVIKGSKSEDAFYTNMMDRYGYGIQMPSNFKVSVRSDEFNGVNRTYGDKRAGLYLYHEDYKGEYQFEQGYIIERRNEVLKRHLHGPDRKDSIPTYVTTDTVNVATFTKETIVNGLKAFETRGWWEMENDYFGGPFVSYTIYCPTQNKVVTVECNVFAPGREKQLLLRQMELAVSTFEEKK